MIGIIGLALVFVLGVPVGIMAVADQHPSARMAGWFMLLGLTLIAIILIDTFAPQWLKSPDTRLFSAAPAALALALIFVVLKRR